MTDETSTPNATGIHAADRSGTHAVGAPYDNASIAARLAGLPQTASARSVAIETEDGTFSGFRAEPAKPGPNVGTAVLVHGWPEYAACWEAVAADLLAGGMSVLAYDQRGYSPGVRPQEVEAYSGGLLARDIDRITRKAGIGEFHLVGHDWGGAAAWVYASRPSSRLRTLTVVATPHPEALARQTDDPDQYERFAYQRAICDHPQGVARALLRDGGRRLSTLYEGAVPQNLITSYVERFQEPGVFDSVLKYYLAKAENDNAGPARVKLGPVTVPTQYIWGSADVAFPRRTAELSAEYATGPYRFVRVEGATHWLPSQHPELISERVLDWAHQA